MATGGGVGKEGQRLLQCEMVRLGATTPARRKGDGRGGYSYKRVEMKATVRLLLHGLKAAYEDLGAGSYGWKMRQQGRQGDGKGGRGDKQRRVRQRGRGSLCSALRQQRWKWVMATGVAAMVDVGQQLTQLGSGKQRRRWRKKRGNRGCNDSRGMASGSGREERKKGRREEGDLGGRGGRG
ncbi:hypothetical protein B296_00047207 [Ensete ventricosum]|uniref:Uncharacterized protein n=1 Tax=Ensete ventricosum TaxID=4639 RepID=A0A426X934_ENSVE|nr:hypothetical protein B296_00047207 [Ensete ventricosum]